jgi:hypothetical protein
VYLTIVGLALSAEIPARYLDPQVLVDVLWTVAGSAGRVEHISAKSGAGRVDVGVYARADSQAGADRSAYELLECATSTVPLLRGWAIRPPPVTGRAAHGA